MRKAAPIPMTFALLATVIAAACGSSNDGGNSGPGTSDAGGQGPGFADGGDGGLGLGDGAECAVEEAVADIVSRPIDIIIAIDNSDSMGDEIEEVQEQINQNFAAIIDAAKLDYRVIMIARHGDVQDKHVCIAAPLSGTTCSPIPNEPVETAKFYHHSTQVESFDAWCKILEQFSAADEFDKHPTGYGALLRPEAFKALLVVTDDQVQCSFGGKDYDDEETEAGGTSAATAFDSALLALSPAQFGTAAKRNYVFHSIIAVEPFDPNNLALAHPPTAPITTERCTPSSESPGTGYQALSKLTGGLRYPSCGLDYTTIFQAIAQNVITGARVPCEFQVPAAPPGRTIDLATAVMQYTPGGGAAQNYGQVPNAAACSGDKFYIESGRIKLCPDLCTKVQSDQAAAVKFLFGCTAGLVK